MVPRRPTHTPSPGLPLVGLRSNAVELGRTHPAQYRSKPGHGPACAKPIAALNAHAGPNLLFSEFQTKTQSVIHHDGAKMVGIIFDCDGVLADNEKQSCASWLPVLERRGLRVNIEDIEPFIGKSDAALIEAFKQRGVPDLDDDALQEREQ